MYFEHYEVNSREQRGINGSNLVCSSLIMAEVAAGQELEDVLHLHSHEHVKEAVLRKGVLIDFIAGCIGGAAGTLVGHPFDTVKVRLQTQGARKTYKGALDCVLNIARKEGVTGFFKGLTAPLLGLTGINAIVFGVHGNAVKYMQPGLKTEILAGTMAGAAQILVITPVELAKTKLQIQGRGQKLQKKNKIYSGTFDCLRKVYKTEGIVGCYRGFLATVLRDVPGLGVYFGVYFSLCHALIQKGQTLKDINAIQLILAGGLTGIASWVYSYPADVIKSKIQAEGLAPVGKYRSYTDCIRTSIKSDGYTVFFRGISVCLLRAFPVNAAVFAGVELALLLLEDSKSF